MIRAFIEGLLGPLGTDLLYFIEANFVTFGLIVLAYGTMMLLSWLTLLRIYRHAVIELATEIHQHPEVNRKSTVKRVSETLNASFETAVQASRFPLVARQGALWPKRLTVEVVTDLIDPDEIYKHALDVLTGTPIRAIKPRYRLHQEERLAAVGRGDKPDDE